MIQREYTITAMKKDRTLMIIILYLIFFTISLVMMTYGKNIFIILATGRYLLGIGNTLIGIIGFINTKEAKHLPFFIAFFLAGIFQIIMNTIIVIQSLLS
jgi:hypothetical protein